MDVAEQGCAANVKRQAKGVRSGEAGCARQLSFLTVEGANESALNPDCILPGHS